jgi:hypothetical protein
MKKTINTTWELWSYDVWGNAEDGYDVNDSICIEREYSIHIKIETNNPGTEREFYSAYPSDYQIRKAFGIVGAFHTWGDETTIYVESDKTGYPIGEMRCVSYEQLSPIKA